MNGLLRNHPPVVVVLVNFVVGLGLAYVGEHYFGLDRGSGGFGVGLMTGVGLGAVLNRPKTTSSASEFPAPGDYVE